MGHYIEKSVSSAFFSSYWFKPISSADAFYAENCLQIM